MFDNLMRPKFSLAMAYASISLIFFILLPFCALAQNNATVPVGSNLSADGNSNPWLSTSGDFAFGFRKLEDKNQFLLCIWHNNIPDQTIAWFPNSIPPVSPGSTVELNAQYGLVLRDPQGRSIWQTDGITDLVNHGLMNDTGNFILMSSDYLWLWESFQDAADTILPLQELTQGSMLISRQSETNFSPGRFSLRFLDNGNLVLTKGITPLDTEDDAVYYNTQTSDASNSSNSGSRVVFDRGGFIYIRKRNNQTTLLTPRSMPVPSENYFRATINFDGVFTLYYHPRIFSGKPSWTSVWFKPDNICLYSGGKNGSGACGYNNVCRLVNGRPLCECPERYDLEDPNDKYGSCKPNFTLSCSEVQQGSEEELFDFVKVLGTDWPENDYQKLTPSTEENCRKACLQDCLCGVSIFRDNSCWKKRLPLSNGWKNPTLTTVAFFKYNKRSDFPTLNPGRHPPGQKPKNRGRLIIVGSVLLGSSVFINFLLIGAACFSLYLVFGKKKLKSYPGNDAVELNLRCFTYKELAEATNGFKEELGRGSFGIVYKGAITTVSRTSIAVKKLERVASDTEKEFRAEVNSIGQTHHKNLVRLLGFCDERHHRLLVYEYISNGTLANFLFNDPKPSWSLRTTIAIGIARGLTYLHEECSTQIIHCDIKPQNILVDEYDNARIADFGLSKLLVLNQSRTLTNIRGTKGYVAPEWFRNTPITAKVDVYSFGVLLLEIITCRRCLEDVEIGEGGPLILIDWVCDCFQERRLDSLVENDLEALEDMKKLERFVMVGIWCIQEDSSLRPTMRKVSQMLEGVVEVTVPPCPDPFPLIIEIVSVAFCYNSFYFSNVDQPLM